MAEQSGQRRPHLENSGIRRAEPIHGGDYPFRNPNLGSTDFPSVVVSGGVATYNVSETFTGVWNQAAGTGSWIKMAGAVTNTCLNGWFPVTGIATADRRSCYPVSFTTPTTCANGTYTESTAQLYHYWVLQCHRRERRHAPKAQERRGVIRLHGPKLGHHLFHSDRGERRRGRVLRPGARTSPTTKPCGSMDPAPQPQHGEAGHGDGRESLHHHLQQLLGKLSLPTEPTLIRAAPARWMRTLSFTVDGNFPPTPFLACAISSQA